MALPETLKMENMDMVWLSDQRISASVHTVHKVYGLLPLDCAQEGFGRAVNKA
ncbi:MAG: hypothetical protein IPH35_20100 [Rhodoferax sp.]|nr:hypothetical protein [Rhodoferax sp.]